MSANGPYVTVFTEASIPGVLVSFRQQESAANAINTAPLDPAAGQPPVNQAFSLQ